MPELKKCPFTIERRGACDVIVYTTGGCRPANESESWMWATLAELRAELEELRKSIAIYCREEQPKIDFDDDDEAVAWFKDQWGE